MTVATDRVHGDRNDQERTPAVREGGDWEFQKGEKA